MRTVILTALLAPVSTASAWDPFDPVPSRAIEQPVLRDWDGRLLTRTRITPTTRSWVGPELSTCNRDAVWDGSWQGNGGGLILPVEPGEDGDRVVVRLVPAQTPFRVDGISYQLLDGQLDNWNLDPTLPHGFSVWIGPAGETPTGPPDGDLETANWTSVPKDPDDEVYLFKFTSPVEVDDPATPETEALVLQAGEALYVAIEMRHAYPRVTAMPLCVGSGAATWWYDADEQDYLLISAFGWGGYVPHVWAWGAPL